MMQQPKGVSIDGIGFLRVLGFFSEDSEKCLYFFNLVYNAYYYYM